MLICYSHLIGIVPHSGAINSYCIFVCLSSESEYAAWTLVNGYALNHVTISIHRLKSHIRDINNLNKFVEDNGFKLNSEGGVLKGLLWFACGRWCLMFFSYICIVDIHLITLNKDGLQVKLSCLPRVSY